MNPRRYRCIAAFLVALPSCADAPPAMVERVEDHKEAPPSKGGDALPTGAISFFKTPLCPNGWFAYGPAAGRFIVPSVGTVGIGQGHGEPLTGGEDRRHVHNLSVRIEPRPVSFAGVVGESNRNVASAAAATFDTATDPASSGLPFVQLLICQKNAPPRPGTRPIPRGTLMFFAEPDCPSEWAQAGATQGRFLVGLPERGALEVSFGAAPLNAQDNRGHAHEASGTVALPPQGIALASGCCANGYAQGGTYKYLGTTNRANQDLPYLRLSQCRKL